MHPGHDSHSGKYLDAAGDYCEGRFREAAVGFAELVGVKCPPAAAYLAQMYLDGEGVPQSTAKGLELLRLGASWGCADAAYNLGVLHCNEAFGVPQDLAASRQYFALAKELGCEFSVEEFLR